MAFTFLLSGRLIPMPAVETAQRWREEQRPRPGSGSRRRTIVGSPGMVRNGIEELAREYGAEEVMIVTITHDHAARRRSYELIADEFGLPTRQRTPARRPSRGAEIRTDEAR